jgi:4-carboxymuconolactone decarboxylase
VTTSPPSSGDHGGGTGPAAPVGDVLRSLAGVEAHLTGGGPGARDVEPQDVELLDVDRGLDDRTAALARLAALVATQGCPASYARGVELAVANGATVDDMVSTLAVVAQIVGIARVVSAAPGLALALGYDVDDALETLDTPTDRAPARRVGDRDRGR